MDKFENKRKEWENQAKEYEKIIEKKDTVMKA